LYVNTDNPNPNIMFCVFVQNIRELGKKRIIQVTWPYIRNIINVLIKPNNKK